MAQAAPLIAGLELGGTKCLALIGRGAEIVAEAHVPTTTPARTLDGLAAILDGWWAHAPFAALGIASFGPIGLDRARADYGHITTTPKPGWGGTDIVGRFAPRFAVPVGFDTDVTGAALAEHRRAGAGAGDCTVYLTIGTGTGGGAIVNGRPLRGANHPEMGHVRVRRVAGDAFAGVCPFHGDCLEGLASGPAVHARTGRPAEALAADDPAWRYVADALAEALAQMILTLSPWRIALGGGVGYGQPHLLPRIRARVGELLAGYVPALDAARLETLIDRTALGSKAGPLGALALALDALEQAPQAR